MRAGAFISLLVALVLGGAAAYMAANWMQGRATASIAPPAATDSVVVAARPLTFGTRLTAENLVQIPWPAGRTPDGAFSSIAELIKDGERVAISPFAANEPILNSKITGPGQRASLSSLIEEGMRAVTIRVDEVRGVAGFVLPGERVDVVLTHASSGGNVSDILLQNVRVLAVDQAVSEQTDKPTVARAVTVEVTTEQAQKIILASDVGKLSLILRQAGGQAAAEDVRRVTRSDLSIPEPVAQLQETQKTAPEPASARIIGVVRGTTRSEYTINR